MTLLEWLAQFVENYFSNLGYSPVAVAAEFSREITKEMNFLREAQATDKLRRYFEHDPNISFPKVYRVASTRNVLTLEEIKGRPLSSVDPKSLLPGERRIIVANGTDAVFKQCLRYGFFHADPHPGNIFLLPDQKLCFIDCGMTGHLDKKTAEQLIDLVAAISQGSSNQTVRLYNTKGSHAEKHERLCGTHRKLTIRCTANHGSGTAQPFNPESGDETNRTPCRQDGPFKQTHGNLHDHLCTYCGLFHPDSCRFTKKNPAF